MHQHIDNVDNHLAFIRDVKLSFREALIKDIHCLRNLKNKDKHEIGDVIAAKAHSFCISNVQKHKWLITKFITNWLLHSTSSEIMRVHKTITSDNVSTGKQGIYFNFFHILHCSKSSDGCHYFHPHSCSTTLDTNCYAIFIARDVINY